MRLPTETIEPLVAAVRDCFGADAAVWLYGSRTDDTARGGDIDLYIETSLTGPIIPPRARLRTRIEALFGEQKIDLSVRPRSRPLAPLHALARSRGVRLDA